MSSKRDRRHSLSLFLFHNKCYYSLYGCAPLPGDYKLCLMRAEDLCEHRIFGLLNWICIRHTKLVSCLYRKRRGERGISSWRSSQTSEWANVFCRVHHWAWFVCSSGMNLISYCEPSRSSWKQTVPQTWSKRFLSASFSHSVFVCFFLFAWS